MLKSLVHTATAFFALMLSWAAFSAILIWGFGEVEPKFGKEWGNFWFYMFLGLMVFGVQTGVIFVGSTLYALVTGRLSLRWAAVGVLVLVVLDHCFLFFHMYFRWGFSPLPALLSFPVVSLVFLFVPDTKKIIGHGGIQPADPCD